MQVRNRGISQSFGTHSLLRQQCLVSVCRHRGSCGWHSEGKNNPGQRWEVFISRWCAVPKVSSDLPQGSSLNSVKKKKTTQFLIKK